VIEAERELDVRGAHPVEGRLQIVKALVFESEVMEAG
jgi:hypothetical protein